MLPNTLIIGAAGQLGAELCTALAQRDGTAHVVAADVRPIDAPVPVEQLDVLDKPRLLQVLRKYNIRRVYHLAALLSASGEQNPQLAWQLNMQGLLNVLDAAVELGLERVFWPSSIAVFGPHTPRQHTPQHCIMDPTSMYGITKLAGERLCEYYFHRYGLDVRSLRYPGLISYNTPPGGGTTDYAVHIFYAALNHKFYSCFLSEHTALPMMYMPDAIKATLRLMEAPQQALTIRSAYNLGALSFTPAEIAAEVRKIIPEFKMEYAPDFRQQIADSWPSSIDDSVARADWGWQPDYTLPTMARDMMDHLMALAAEQG